MLPSASFLLIPDISGFTSFVHNTELEHSQHIILQVKSTFFYTSVSADDHPRLRLGCWDTGVRLRP